MRHLRHFALTILLITAVGLSLYAQEPALRRFGLFIGANDGGQSRVTLRWAISDAQRVADVMTEIGGVLRQDAYVLTDPTGQDLELQFAHLREKIRSAADDVRRTEFVLYYSGHSDESGVMLGEDHVSYVELRRAIDDVGADVNIAILDSCASGAFTRLKGGAFVQPFLVDESSDVSGHAFLTSSSEDEASQESDQLGSSFFTHYLVSGLRGAADLSDDQLVTLDEVYLYAREETLTRTASTFAGPQHASFDFQLNGTGSLILTNLTVVDAALEFDESIGGRLYITRATGGLVAEVLKSPADHLTMALPSGSYVVTLEGDERNYEHRVDLLVGSRLPVTSSDFRVTFKDRNRVRGDEVDESPFNITLIPGISLLGYDPDILTFSLGLITANAYRVEGGMLSGVIASADEDVLGAQLAGVGSSAGGNLRGVQSSGVYNVVGGNAVGVQSAGVFNHVDGHGAFLQSAGVFNISTAGFDGVQVAGVFNLTDGTLNGAQISGVYNQSGAANGAQVSLVNIADDVNGAQIGLVNIGKRVTGTQIGLVNISEEMYGVPLGIASFVERGIHNVSVWWEGEDRTWLGVQNGSNLFYTLAYAGIKSDSDWTNLDELGTGAGVGFRFTTRPFFIDIDFGVKRIAEGDSAQSNLESLFDPAKGATFSTGRIMAGVGIGDGLGWFAGANFDIRSPLSTDNAHYFDSLGESFSIGSGETAIDIYPTFFTGFRF